MSAQIGWLVVGGTVAIKVDDIQVSGQIRARGGDGDSVCGGSGGAGGSGKYIDMAARVTCRVAVTETIV